jgi:PPOX class probable FMN-dependent enzyme
VLAVKTEAINGRMIGFADNADELRALYGAPSELAVKKSLTQLDEHCRLFIARSPFLCLSSAAADGSADVSPRGDAPGFVRVLDDHTLFVPDRLGNNRIDSMMNLLHNPHIGLIFFIPGVNETLRVNGRARIVLQSELLSESQVDRKTPKSGLLIEVREAFLQCAKALIRSRLWKSDQLLPRNQFPTLGKILVDQIGLTMPVAELDALIDQAYCDKLY